MGIAKRGGTAVLAPRRPKIGTGDLGIWPPLFLFRAGGACGWLAAGAARLFKVRLAVGTCSRRGVLRSAPCNDAMR
jgi:hypothetical protein